MEDNQLGLAMAVVTFVVIAVYQVWKNLSARTLTFGLAMLFGLCVMAAGFVFVPPNVLKSPLFFLGMIAVGFLCIPLMRWRMLGHPEAPVVFARMSSRGNWRPPLWWSPVALVLAVAWLFSIPVLMPNIDPDLGVYIILVPAGVLSGASGLIAMYRLQLWWRGLFFDGD